MKSRKEKSKKKLSPSEYLEASIRREYVPGQIARNLNEIVAIEVNALWRATPEGKKAAKDEDNYSPEDLKEVLKKQEANKARIQVKVDFLKRLYDQQEKNVQS